MSGIIIGNGAAASAEATVDTNGNVHVVTPQTTSQAGYARLLGEIGGLSDPVSDAQAVSVSTRGALSTALDTPFFNIEFVGTNIPQAHIVQSTTTMTIAQAGGFLTLNNSGITTINTAAQIRTYVTLPVFPGRATDLVVEFRAKMSFDDISNRTAELGIGLASGTSAPTDGIFFRWNSSGELRGVINYNTTETQTATITHPGTASNCNTYKITIDAVDVRFWINATCVAKITLLSSAAAQALPTSSTSLPLFARVYNAGSAPSNASKLEIASISAWLTNGDLSTLPANLVMSGRGAYQTQSGNASGITNNWTNSLAFSSFTLSNTAAGSTGLGGLFQFAAAAGAATDYALFGYTVPAGTSTLPGKTLMITGMHISAWNAGAANSATVPTTLLFGLGVGSTAVSLATTDGAATVGPRRIPLGVLSIPVNAVIGQNADREIHVLFANPIPAPSGTFVHCIMRIVSGAATASQLIQGTVSFDGFWR